MTSPVSDAASGSFPPAVPSNVLYPSSLQWSGTSVRLERLVWRRKVERAPGLGENALAVEDQRPHLRAAQAEVFRGRGLRALDARICVSLFGGGSESTVK